MTSFMDGPLVWRQSSISGVRSTSGVWNCEKSAWRAREYRRKTTPGRTRPARPFRCAAEVFEIQEQRSIDTSVSES